MTRARGRRRVRAGVLRCGSALSVLAAVTLVLAPVSGAADAQEVSWWARSTPLSSDDRVEGRSGTRPTTASITTAEAGEPRQQLPPPPTTVPAPVPPPTTPPSPVTLPEAPVNPPTATQVPDGGAYVANGASGATGMSALRFDAPDTGAAMLVLEVAATSTPLGPLQACPALSGWLGAENGPWSARPAHDCDRLAISGLLSEDGTTVTFALPETFPPPGSVSYDVLLLPETGTGAVFSVAFEAPGPEAFTPLGSRVEHSDMDPLLPVTDLGPIAPDDAGTGGVDLGLGGSGTVALDDPTTGTSGDASPGTGSSVGGRGDELTHELVGAIPPLPLPESRVARIVAAAMLVAMAGTFYRLAGAEPRPPRLLGAMAGGTAPTSSPAALERGVGRFRRPRHGPPVPLA